MREIDYVLLSAITCERHEQKTMHRAKVMQKLCLFCIASQQLWSEVSVILTIAERRWRYKLFDFVDNYVYSIVSHHRPIEMPIFFRNPTKLVAKSNSLNLSDNAFTFFAATSHGAALCNVQFLLVVTAFSAIPTIFAERTKYRSTIFLMRKINWYKDLGGGDVVLVTVSFIVYLIRLGECNCHLMDGIPPSENAVQTNETNCTKR